ncbi:hypothetical protein STRPS_1249 [Streptococcus pseudoporcinus LQ 940-04]|uniref:Uncharacterized protein n=1 Tax=Streptococcus pseudoporcinus LQ 940-04 TaxID=875093 RepID=G5K7U0_9STRE|nr:hypothetical protein HMPREF9320_1982 [Streptococcus pseudoporcinus SPIN 20026]EHI65241.1 hypothetical protein STRPS_1249 [Streptococcus pseudoporcinus LQ 940-04]
MIFNLPFLSIISMRGFLEGALFFIFYFAVPYGVYTGFNP